MAFTTHVLVVANQTVDSSELLDALRQRAERGPIHVTMLAPCSFAERGQATERLQSATADLEAAGIEAATVLGDADPSHAAREMGIRLFAQLLSVLTWSRVTDPACGYRAVRTEALRGLEFRQDQFHNSEFIVEASKKHLHTIEVPVTVSSRLSGTSKKPPHFRYGMGFANALVRAWLR